MFEIGSSLREARLRQGLDFVQAEQATKIRGKYLRALEDEQFASLPAETYVRGFLRTYADYLGLEGQLYVDEYNSRYVVEHDGEPLRPRRVSGPRRQRHVESRVLVLTLAGIVALTGLVIVAWRFGGGNRRSVLLPTVSGPVAGGAGGTDAKAAPLLLVRGLRGHPVVTVRAGSSAGRPLFAGTLEPGDVQRFREPRRLWLRISEPRDVRVVVGGHTVPRGAIPPTAVVSHGRLVARG